MSYTKNKDTGTFSDLVLNRRSIRRYTGEIISEKKLNQIVDAGLLAPSSRDRKSAEMILVTDPEMLGRLSEVKAGTASMLTEAAAAVVVIGDREKSDMWIEDCAAAMIQMHLQAFALGIGSCWVQCRGRKTADGRDSDEAVRELMHYPDRFSVEAILSIGMPDEKKSGYYLETLDRSRAHKEIF